MLLVLRQQIVKVLLILMFFLVSVPPQAIGNIDAASEYQIKAVFLYKFLFFADWPQDTIDNSEGTIIIGILGKDSFGDAFESVEGETVYDRKLVIKRFKKGSEADSLKNCHLLFISSSLEKSMEGILKSLKKYPVLTVSEMDGFGELGGMINFIKKGDYVRFEINKEAAGRVGIRFRSKLLRVATRIVED